MSDDHPTYAAGGPIPDGATLTATVTPLWHRTGGECPACGPDAQQLLAFDKVARRTVLRGPFHIVVDRPREAAPAPRTAPCRLEGGPHPLPPPPSSPNGIDRAGVYGF